eukprot:CAMPEP_0184393520 /NCGR_PEP_ID=MMETSP0007-20130409/34920_1 /TAXON_ID=97485 /ORGANISM="Prymnesium parvum, Strain Texoma1" /LENGTH=101 /DNA_ID=CAMNT_0026744553 /DNA_START=93 /DNA_END=396 /DNA_ORIENTATION=+
MCIKSAPAIDRARLKAHATRLPGAIYENAFRDEGSAEDEYHFVQRVAQRQRDRDRLDEVDGVRRIHDGLCGCLTERGGTARQDARVLRADLSRAFDAQLLD